MSICTYKYDALAAEVKLKHVTSCRHNRALLHRIKNNDPGITHLSLVSDVLVNGIGRANDDEFIVREDDDEDSFGWLGYFVGYNEHITFVTIYNLPRDKDSVKTMFQGFQRNASISSVETLIEDGDEELIAMSSGLASIRSLKNLYLGVGNVGEQWALAFAASLADTPSLEVLELGLPYNNIGDEGAKALAESLACTPSITKLSLCDNNIGDEGAKALAESLACTPSITKLSLCDNNIGDEGAKALALAESLACTPSITKLSLCDNNIGDEGLTALASFVAASQKLKELWLSSNNLGDQGVEALASALSSQSQSRLQSLYLNGNTWISARGLRAVERILQSRKCTIDYLSLDRINIGEEGGAFLARALSSNKSLLTLSLRDASINDIGMRNLAAGLSSNTSLQNLDLSCNTSITAAGLSHFKQYFQSPTCSLQVLDIYFINIGDEGALALVDALAHSKSLKELGIRGESSGVSVTGLKAFSKLLCDLSAPNNAYLSNHLRSIGDLRSWNAVADEYLSNILSWFEVNKISSSWGMIAKTKVLCCFLLSWFPDLHMTPLFQWDLKLLPFVKAWFQSIEGRGTYETIICSRELSAIYSFVRGMPVWVADDGKQYLTEQLDATNRKLQEEIQEIEKVKLQLVEG